ncbi:MAG: ABC transporter substrate-binding protein [Phycisphaerales bacterium]
MSGGEATTRVSAKPRLTLAHSADADDVFMWWPITGKVDPANAANVIEPPAIDTGPFGYSALPEDIQRLNLRAVTAADLEITAISYAAYAHCAANYVITSCGSSFGDGYGPKLVAPAALAGMSVAEVRKRRWRIAVPGVHTTAYLVLSVLLGRDGFTGVETPFDQIIDAVTAGKVDAGLVIHEGQLLFAERGLGLVADMGTWWKQQTGLPLPLGANAVSRRLETQFGPGTLKQVVRTLKASLDYALANRAESLAYAKTFSPLKGDAELNRYIDMYVNRWTVDAGAEGIEAVQLLLRRGADLGLLPDPGPVQMLVP